MDFSSLHSHYFLYIFRLVFMFDEVEEKSEKRSDGAEQSSRVVTLSGHKSEIGFYNHFSECFM